MSALSRLGVALAATVGFLSCPPAHAWDRGNVENFATIPVLAPGSPGPVCPNNAASCTSDIEGVAVGPDGSVYSASFGFNSEGSLGGNGVLFVFAPNGKLLRQFPVPGSTPHLIGLVYQQSSKNVLVADLVAAGNIGCITQLAGGSPVPVVHTVELLDWATGGPPPRALSAIPTS